MRRCDAIGSLLGCFDQANAPDVLDSDFPLLSRFGDAPEAAFLTERTPLVVSSELIPETKAYDAALIGAVPELVSSGLIRTCWREANARSCSNDEVFPGATGIMLLEDDEDEDSLDEEKIAVFGARSITSYGTAQSDSNSMQSIASMTSFAAGMTGNGSGSANYHGSEPFACDTSVLRRSVSSVGNMWIGAAIPPGHVPMIDLNQIQPHLKYPCHSNAGSPTAVSGTVTALDGIPSPSNGLPKKRVIVPSRRNLSDAELMASFAPKGNKKRPAGPRVQGKVAPNPHGLACSACGTQTTPVWRAGPHGPKTLCNACGVRYMKVAKRK